MTLDNIVEMARAHEMAESQARQIEEDSVRSRQDRPTGSDHKVNKVGHQNRPSGNFSSEKGRNAGNFPHPNRSKQKAGKPMQQNCWRCGLPGHWQSDCSVAVNRNCRKCGKLGHLARVCRTTMVSEHMASSDQKMSVSHSEMKKSSGKM